MITFSVVMQLNSVIGLSTIQSEIELYLLEQGHEHDRNGITNYVPLVCFSLVTKDDSPGKSYNIIRISYIFPKKQRQRKL